MPLRRTLALLAVALIVAAQPAAAYHSGNERSIAQTLASTIPPATGPIVKLRVERAGVQFVSRAALLAAGLDLAAVDASRLWLRSRGEPVALELGADGLRFFAPEPGDRWNAADTYWLTLEAAPGPRILAASAPTGGPLRTTALQRGTVRGLTRYESLTPGADGDHWFLADLRAGSALPPATGSVALPESLPVVMDEQLVLQVTGSAYVGGTHRLRARAGSAEAVVSWSGDGDWSQTITLAGAAPNVNLTLLANDADATLVDSVAWQRTVTLDATGNGAFFHAFPGVSRYQLAQPPAAAALYDVSQPRTPLRLPLSGGSFAIDGGADGRALVLAGPGTLHEPPATAYAPSDIAAPRDADVIYIGPAALHSALEPLLAQRRAQGYTPTVVDVQAIYDGWSDGQVSPVAIRSFLRRALATWPRRPVAVVLVGDGSSDPLDRTGRGANNVNLVPPYLAMVDPWIGETACEACYSHLDGDDPRADPTPDLLIGRLPVKSAAELGALVAKIVAYETAPAGAAWARRQVFVADNYREADGTVDRAGDFAAVANQLAATLPVGAEIARVYYDPTAPADASDGRVRDAARAREATLAALDDGAGVVTYFGHGSNYQWATTDLGAPDSYMLGLYGPDTLTNADRLPMVLSMTCLTGAFQTPAFSGTTIDERLLLNGRGGAIAVLAPTGFGVLHGHDAIVRGFFRAIQGDGAAVPGVRDWRAVGALVQAGFQEVRSTTPCCDDAVYTFALLGDPLTPLRAAEQRVALPLARK